MPRKSCTEKALVLIYDMHTTNPALEAICAACAPDAPPPRAVDVFMSRAELARVAGVPTGRVFRAFADGALTPDAVDAKGAPLFLLVRLPLLKAALEKHNAAIAC